MKFFIAISFFLSLYCVNAQTLTENMGALSCDFEFSSNGNKLQVEKQQLIERVRAKKEVSTTENESYGLGYAYTEWQLEFVLKSEFATRRSNELENADHRSKYCIQFLDSNGVILLKTYLAKEILTYWKAGTDAEPTHIYSLNMVSFPFVILDEVSLIEIVWISPYR